MKRPSVYAPSINVCFLIAIMAVFIGQASGLAEESRYNLAQVLLVFVGLWAAYAALMFLGYWNSNWRETLKRMPAETIAKLYSYLNILLIWIAALGSYQYGPKGWQLYCAIASCAVVTFITHRVFRDIQNIISK